MSTTVILRLCAYASRSAWASSMEFLQGKTVTPLPELHSLPGLKHLALKVLQPMPLLTLYLHPR